jgi:hypothetical protein
MWDLGPTSSAASPHSISNPSTEAEALNEERLVTLKLLGEIADITSKIKQCIPQWVAARRNAPSSKDASSSEGEDASVPDKNPPISEPATEPAASSTTGTELAETPPPDEEDS